jgi:hypothetical protein
VTQKVLESTVFSVKMDQREPFREQTKGLRRQDLDTMPSVHCLLKDVSSRKPAVLIHSPPRTTCGLCWAPSRWEQTDGQERSLCKDRGCPESIHRARDPHLRALWPEE